MTTKTLYQRLKTSRERMRISNADWAVFPKHLHATLDALKIPQAERGELIAFVETTKADMVQA